MNCYIFCRKQLLQSQNALLVPKPYTDAKNAMQAETQFLATQLKQILRYTLFETSVDNCYPPSLIISYNYTYSLLRGLHRLVTPCALEQCL